DDHNLGLHFPLLRFPEHLQRLSNNLGLRHPVLVTVATQPFVLFLLKPGIHWLHLHYTPSLLHTLVMMSSTLYPRASIHCPAYVILTSLAFYSLPWASMSSFSSGISPRAFAIICSSSPSFLRRLSSALAICFSLPS